jgi:hypothetical protein
MKLVMDTSSMTAQACGPFEPRLDRDGVQRRDKSGGTNLPLNAVKLVVWFDGDAETILVTVPVSDPPKVSQGDYVRVERLEAIPWVQNGNARVAFRAKAIVPVNGTAPSGAKPAPAPANH